MSDTVLIIGGGVTGIHAATVLAELGHPSVIIEKGGQPGGHVLNLSSTFPFFKDDGFVDGAVFVADLLRDLESTSLVTMRLSTELTAVEGECQKFVATLSDGTRVEAGAILVTAGYEPFDPSGLPEYGYGVYPNVITASELEWMLNPRGPTRGELRRPSDGAPVRRLGIVFCVGSRNRRIGAPFCSRICCSYSTKQAMTVLERDPSASVVCFYMDVRTYDRGFEEMYSRAQERGVTYIRGRVSSCRQQPDGSVAIRAENTLIGKPFWEEFDLASLSTGMRPFRDVDALSQMLRIERAPDGFLMCRSWFRYPHDSTRAGVFIAGCATGIKPIRNCLIDAASAASRISAVLRGRAPAVPVGPPHDAYPAFEKGHHS